MPDIHDVSPEVTFEKYDLIDRRSYSEHLASFLNSKAEDGYVINLNAEWGAGKTTFLHCWYNELKKNHPVVYFDAWKSDFTHDAMLALLEAFYSQLMCSITNNKDLLNKLLGGGEHFLKSTSWKLLAGFIKRQGGMESDDSFFSDISEDLERLHIQPSDLTDSLKETFSSMLEQKKKLEGIHNFKETLVELSNAYLQEHSNKNIPIYVLIDELDRCRPTYAIEVIESVKHFFNTKSFVFVLATDTDQLQHSIKAVYGEGFDSSSYLSRFFDNTIMLEAPKLEEYLKLKLSELAEDSPPHKHARSFILELFQYHKMDSLREIEKVLETISIARTVNKCFKLFPLTILAILKHKYPQFLTQYLSDETPPYQHSNQINHNMKGHLPTNITQTFNFTRQSRANTSYICNLVLRNIDDQLKKDSSIWITQQLKSNGLRTVIPSFSSLVLLNPDEELASKDDYVSVVNFAGHLV